MILVTRLNGSVFALNPDLVERADCTPDTVITLVDGTKYLITESLPEFIELVHGYRVALIADARHVDTGSTAITRPRPDTDSPHTTAKVVPLHRKDR